MSRRTVAIVQARMHSTRLPNKIMLPLGDRTVLAYVLQRCAAIASVDAVCCAIPDANDCAPIAAEAERCGAMVFRGSETDVLSRYAGAARWLESDVVLRVTSDCPLIDPDVCEAVLDLHRREDADYAANNMPPSWPHGLDCEAVTTDWLARSDAEAERPSEREHVTQYVRHHPDAKRVNLSCPENGQERYRWTLDTEADYRFFQALWDKLPSAGAGWRQVAQVLNDHRDLQAINANEDRHAGLRKSMADDRTRGFGERGIV